MLRRCPLVILLLVSVFSIGTAAASTSRPIVYSKVNWERVGSGGTVERGGLFAAIGGKARQLTYTSRDSQPSVAPDGDVIAFVRVGDLYAMNADGSHQRQLTSGSEVDERPLVSPNGRYVVFVRRESREATGDLYTVPISGGPPHPLATSPGEDREAAFSPDGKAIVFVRSLPVADGGTNDDLYSVRPTGAGLTRLTRTPQNEFRPHYFADGIVFDRRKTAAGGPATIFTMRCNGSGVRVLVARKRGANISAVSPNGRLLLFSGPRGMWAQRLVRSGGGSRPHLLSRPGGSYLVFSPDGRRVAGIFMSSGAIFGLRSIDVRTGASRGEGEVFELEAPGPVQTNIDGFIAW